MMAKAKAKAEAAAAAAKQAAANADAKHGLSDKAGAAKAAADAKAKELDAKHDISGKAGAAKAAADAKAKDLDTKHDISGKAGAAKAAADAKAKELDAQHDISGKAGAAKAAAGAKAKELDEKAGAAIDARSAAAEEGMPPAQNIVSETPKSITLKYWNGRGLMEVPRQLLAIAGVPFKEFRCADANHKSTGNPAEGAIEEVADTLDWNLGRMPICEAETDAGVISMGQGPTICRFLASMYGLNGSNLYERAQIDSIVEALGELKGAFNKAEDKALFFTDATASDVKGMADRAGRPNRGMIWYAGRIEGLVAEGGCAVGGAISLADVMIYSTFAEHSDEAESPDMDAARRGPFQGRIAETKEVLAAHPKLAAICEAVAANANFAAYLVNRGPQGF